MKPVLVLMCLAALACGDDDSLPDSGSTDVGTATLDAELAMDADGQNDAGEPDASEPDAAPADASTDSPIVDAGTDSPIADADTDVGVDAGTDAGQDAGPPITCMATGCSGQLCAEMPTASTCEFRPWYVCYPDATCEGQPDGMCGWTPTPEFLACLEANGAPDPS